MPSQAKTDKEDRPSKSKTNNQQLRGEKFVQQNNKYTFAWFHPGMIPCLDWRGMGCSEENFRTHDPLSLQRKNNWQDQGSRITTCMTADLRGCGKWPAEQRDMGDLFKRMTNYNLNSDIKSWIRLHILRGSACAGSRRRTEAPCRTATSADVLSQNLETSIFSCRNFSIFQDWNQQLASPKTKRGNRTLSHHDHHRVKAGTRRWSVFPCGTASLAQASTVGLPMQVKSVEPKSDRARAHTYWHVMWCRMWSDDLIRRCYMRCDLTLAWQVVRWKRFRLEPSQESWDPMAGEHETLSDADSEDRHQLFWGALEGLKNQCKIHQK